MDGAFDNIEIDSGAILWKIGNDWFNKSYVWVDGIYPQYSRFVKAIKHPASKEENNFNNWQ